jgi:hypothetical protein
MSFTRGEGGVLVLKDPRAEAEPAFVGDAVADASFKSPSVAPASRDLHAEPRTLDLRDDRSFRLHNTGSCRSGYSEDSSVDSERHPAALRAEMPSRDARAKADIAALREELRTKAAAMKRLDDSLYENATGSTAAPTTSSGLSSSLSTSSELTVPDGVAKRSLLRRLFGGPW